MSHQFRYAAVAVVDPLQVPQETYVCRMERMYGEWLRRMARYLATTFHNPSDVNSTSKNDSDTRIT